MLEETVIRWALRDGELWEVKQVITTGNIICCCLLLRGAMAITINTPFAAARWASNNPSGHVDVDGLHHLHCCRH
jgi:hypothetical protein